MVLPSSIRQFSLELQKDMSLGKSDREKASSESASRFVMFTFLDGDDERSRSGQLSEG